MISLEVGLDINTDPPLVPRALGRGSCKLILDPNYSGNTVVGGKFSSLRDRSGKNNHAAQASGALQLTKASGIVNGHSVMRGTGTGTHMTFAGGVPIGASATIAVVASPLTGNGYLFSDGASSTAILGGFFSHVFSWFNNTDRGTFTDAATGFHTMIITQAAGGNFIGYYDGTQVFSTAVAIPLNSITHLMNSNGLAQGAIGDMAYMAAYASVLTSGERAHLQAWLKRRFGTP